MADAVVVNLDSRAAHGSVLFRGDGFTLCRPHQYYTGTGRSTTPRPRPGSSDSCKHSSRAGHGMMLRWLRKMLWRKEPADVIEENESVVLVQGTVRMPTGGQGGRSESLSDPPVCIEGIVGQSSTAKPGP